MTLSSDQAVVINDNTTGDISPADVRTALGYINTVLVNDGTAGAAYGRALLGLANQAALTALIAAATTTLTGAVELATDAETITGTDTTRAVTPSNLTAAYLKLSGGTLTGALVLPDGLVGSPALTFSADPDTGIFRFNLGGQFMDLVVNGVSQLRVGSDATVRVINKLRVDQGTVAGNVIGASYTVAANQFSFFSDQLEISDTFSITLDDSAILEIS